MATAALRRLLILITLVGALALPAVAQAAPGDAEVNEFYVHPSTTQAGGHPDVHLYFRFCNAAPHVVTATNPDPIVITTDVAHGLTTNDEIAVRGVIGNTAANIDQGQAEVLSPTTFALHQFVSSASLGPAIAGNGQYSSGGWVSKFGSPPFGATAL